MVVCLFVACLLSCVETRIGDGANDLRMMEEAGVSIAFHAKPVVQRSASYAINHNGLDAVLPLLGDIPEIL